MKKLPKQKKANIHLGDYIAPVAGDLVGALTAAYEPGAHHQGQNGLEKIRVHSWHLFAHLNTRMGTLKRPPMDRPADAEERNLRPQLEWAVNVLETVKNKPDFLGTLEDVVATHLSCARKLLDRQTSN